jgi:hypothetical protein
VTFEERMAERQAQQAPLKEGRVSEHGPAKFRFVTPRTAKAAGPLGAH